MAKVTLDFVPPEEPDILALHIYESALPDAGFVEIERVTNIGASPNYITRYTTSVAASITDWFAIAWENAAGDTGIMSQSIQGGTTTVVSEVLNRVLLRDPTLDERIVVESAEYVISTALNVPDPYDPNLTVNYRQLEGLTLLTLARSTIQTIMTSSSSESYTAGLVSEKSATGTGSNEKMIEWLIKEANKILGINYTLVMLLEDIDVTGLNTQTSISYDQSRQAITVNFE